MPESNGNLAIDFDPEEIDPQHTLEDGSKEALPAPTEPHTLLETIAVLEEIAKEDPVDINQVQNQMGELMSVIFEEGIPMEVKTEALNRLIRIKHRIALSDLEMDTITDVLTNENGAQEHFSDKEGAIIIQPLPDGGEMEIKTINDVVAYLDVLAKEDRELWKDLQLMDILGNFAKSTVSENLDALKELGIEAAKGETGTAKKKSRKFVANLTKMLKQKKVLTPNDFLEELNSQGGLDVLYRNQGEAIVIKKINTYADELRKSLQERPGFYRVLAKVFHLAVHDGSVLPRLPGDKKYVHPSKKKRANQNRYNPRRRR